MILDQEGKVVEDFLCVVIAAIVIFGRDQIIEALETCFLAGDDW